MLLCSTLHALTNVSTRILVLIALLTMVRELLKEIVSRESLNLWPDGQSFFGSLFPCKLPQLTIQISWKMRKSLNPGSNQQWREQTLFLPALVMLEVLDLLLMAHRECQALPIHHKLHAKIWWMALPQWAPKGSQTIQLRCLMCPKRQCLCSKTTTKRLKLRTRS